MDKITYIGHSGFAIESEEIIIVIDYYTDEFGVIPQLLSLKKPMIVMASHSHSDHFNKGIFSWADNDIEYVLSNEIRRKCGKSIPSNTHFIKVGERIEYDNIKIEAFGSTDCGCSFVTQMQNRTYFHAGDLNNWHWKAESTPQEIKKAESDFLAIVRNIAKNYHDIDVAFFPVDARMGEDYSLGARQFLSMINVGTFIPMHFWEYKNEAFAIQKYINPNFGTVKCLNEGESLIV